MHDACMDVYENCIPAGTTKDPILPLLAIASLFNPKLTRDTLLPVAWGRAKGTVEMDRAVAVAVEAAMFN